MSKPLVEKDEMDVVQESSMQKAARKHPVIAHPTESGMNVVTKEEYTELAKFVFGQIVDVLSNSFGPYGSMTLINRAGYRFSTKDGWRILMHTVFDHNLYYQAIHRMIFEVCEQMNDTVGDGTTTVILIANRIYNSLVQKMDVIDGMDIPPREVFKAFDQVVQDLTKGIEEIARPFSPEYVRQIASIATNDDKEITDCLCELYERDPEAEIQIMESNKIGVSVEKVDGLKIPVNLIDRIYVNNKVEKCCDLENGLYLVFNHKLGESVFTNIILPAEAAARKMGQKLVVIAPAYEESVMIGMWLKKATDEFRSTGTCTTILMQYKSTVLGFAGAEDLAILLDTHPIDAKLVEYLISKDRKTTGTMDPRELADGLRFGKTDTGRIMMRNHGTNTEVILGICENAKLGYDTPSFFSGLHPVSMTLDAQKEAVKAEIKGLEDTMTVTEKETSMKLSTLRKRLSRLELKMSVIYYGADSGFDKEMLHDTIEDGVRALESARSHGIVKGSQYDLMNVCKKYLSRTDLSEIQSLIARSILTGIQNMLRYDLYDKSKLYHSFESVLFMRKEDGKAVFDTSEYADDPRFKQLKKSYMRKKYGLIDTLMTDHISDMDPLNLITMQEDPGLITSAETDICALKASIELIKILIAGNQLLMVDN